MLMKSLGVEIPLALPHELSFQITNAYRFNGQIFFKNFRCKQCIEYKFLE